MRGTAEIHMGADEYYRHVAASRMDRSDTRQAGIVGPGYALVSPVSQTGCTVRGGGSPTTQKTRLTRELVRRSCSSTEEQHRERSNIGW